MLKGVKMMCKIDQTLLAADPFSGAFNLLNGTTGKILLWMAGGLVLAALLVFAFRGLMMLKDRAKAIPFGNLIKGAAGRSPAGVADPAKVARLDDLRKKFEEGVEKFKSAGKDLYSLPWYLLVGPAGSGKTEALRHCKVGFPPGLQDCFQGAGGTLNMHWWFMNQAVVLDTAGRMFMEEAALQGGSEWREFLKLLKQSRPNAPLNGMLLVIGVDSLIKDTAEQIEQKAGHIAKQLDTIQRTLDVRFPVYVIITKCDLITGFREFFDKIDDPQLQHQMLGWSNPAALDEAFKADGVENHIKTVRSRLLKYRAGLLIDPVHTEDPQARRTDQIDELFSLPDNLAKIAPRLRKYLEIIFQAGEWSPKPLFLRGIYFSSSMRQGQALDEEVAAAMGVPVDAIPGGKVWDEERSFFLRDIFVSKIFKERGLVTRATNVHKEQTGRRRKLIGVGIGVVVGLIGLTAYGSYRLRQEVQEPLEFWTSVANVSEEKTHDGESLLAIVTWVTQTQAFINMADQKVFDDGDKEAKSGISKDKTRLELLSAVHARLDMDIATGLFSPVTSINSLRKEAGAAVMQLAILDPVVRTARTELAKKENAGYWKKEDRAKRALAALTELTAAETVSRGLKPADEKKGKALNVNALVSFLTDINGTVPAKDKDKANPLLDTMVESVPRAYFQDRGIFGSKDSLEELEKAAASAGPCWTTIGKSGDYELGKLVQLHDATKAFGEEAKALRDPFVIDAKYVKSMPGTLDDYNKLVQEHSAGLRHLTEGDASRYVLLRALYGKNSGSLDKIGTEQSLFEDVKKGLLDKKVFEEVATALPAELREKDAAKLERLAKAIEDAKKAALDGLQLEAASVSKGINVPEIKSLLERPTSGEAGFETVVRAHKVLDGLLVKPEPAKDWLGTASESEKVATAVTSALADVAKLRDGSKDLLKGTPVFTAVERGIAIARGGRLSSAIEELFKGLEVEGKKDIQQAIVAASKDEEFLPVIPFTNLRAKDKKPEFASRGTRQLLSAWKVVKDSLADDAKAGLIVSGKALWDASQNHKTVVRAYASKYADYWLARISRADADARVRKFATWGEFFKEYDENKSELKAKTINEPLRARYEQLAGDLQLIDDIFGATHAADIAGLQKQASEYADGSSKGDKEINEFKDALRALTQDGDKVPSVRNKVRLMDSKGIDELQSTMVANVGAFWHELPIRAMEAIAKSSDIEALDNAKKLVEVVKFPLIRNQAAGVMRFEDLDAVDAALAALPIQGAPEPKAVKPGDFHKELRSVVEGIFNPGRESLAQTLKMDNVTKMTNLLKLYRGTSGKSMVKSIEIVDLKAPTGFTSARDGAQGVKFEVVGQPAPKTLLIQEAASDLADGKSQSLTVSLMESVQVEKLVGEPRHFDDPWCAAFLLAQPDVTKEGAEWFVPVVVKRGADRLWFKLKVKLRVEFPDLRDWPESITP